MHGSWIILRVTQGHLKQHSWTQHDMTSCHCLGLFLIWQDINEKSSISFHIWRSMSIHSVETVEWIKLIFGTEATLGVSYIVFWQNLGISRNKCTSSGIMYQTRKLTDFWATACKTVHPMLSDRCLSQSQSQRRRLTCAQKLTYS